MKQFKNIEKNNFINLIISGVLNKKIDNLKLSDPNKMITLSTFFSLEAIIYNAFKINNIEIDDKFKKIYKEAYMKALVQDSELGILLEEFSKAHLYHLPLKGSILRTYYDDPTKRSMADLDILFHEEDLEKAGEVVKELGYEEEQMGGNHDVYYKKPFMNIELHRAMIDISYDTHDYYNDIWDRLDCHNYTATMTKEDFLIFNIIHAGKHFITGGAGLRFLIDLYFFNQKEKELNWEYIKEELKKVGYDKYAEIMFSISDKLFKEIDLNDDELYILDYLLKSGTYGTFDNAAAIGVAKEDNKKGSKLRFFFKRVFPPFTTMVRIYPNLAKHKILLPFYYIKRIFRVVFKSKTYKEQLKSIDNVNDKDIERVKKAQDIVGIRG